MMKNNHYDLSQGSWVVYGLEVNDHEAHTLRFLAQTDTPEQYIEDSPEVLDYEACCAYRLDTMIQVDRDTGTPELVIEYGLPPLR